MQGSSEMAEGVCFPFPERSLRKCRPERALVPIVLHSPSSVPPTRVCCQHPSLQCGSLQYEMALGTEARAGSHCPIWKADPGPGCRLFLQQPLPLDTLPTPLTSPPPYALPPPVGSVSLSDSGCPVSFMMGSLSLGCSLLKVSWQDKYGMFSQPLWNLCSVHEHQTRKVPRATTGDPSVMASEGQNKNGVQVF